RVGVSTIRSAGRASMAEMFWWARPRVRPVSSTSSRVSRAITPIMSVNRPLAWTMSFRATNMTQCHRVPAPCTSAPEDRLRDREGDADRSVRTMGRGGCPNYSVAAETDRTHELTRHERHTDDADRSVRTMARAACSTYSVGVETDRAPELTGPFVDSDGDAAGTATALAATLRGAMHLAFVVLPSVGALRAISVDAVPPAMAV